MAINPLPNQFGSADITLTISDGELQASTTFAVIVDAVNDVPTISAITNRTIPKNGATGPVPFVVGDIDNSPASLVVSATSANPALIPDANLILAGTGTNRTISVTPAANQTGTATVTVAVSDGMVSASTPFTVTVTGSSYFAFEAENASLVSPMSVMLNSRASNSRYIATTKSDQGRATFTLQVFQADTYVVWCRVLAPNSSRDSFYLSADGGVRDVLDIVPRSSSWQWILANGRGGTGEPGTLDPRTFNLSVGTHTLVFSGRERWTGLDRIVVSNDRSFVPTNEPMQDALPPIPSDENLRVEIRLQANELILSWTANSESTYRLVYKETLDDPDWILLPDDVNVSAGTATWTVSHAESVSRYYRVYRIR